MALMGTAPGLYPGEVDAVGTGLLPGESWEQFIYRLFSERQYEQNRALQDERTRMQFASQRNQLDAQMGADAAQQRSQLAINRNRNDMQLFDVAQRAKQDALYQQRLNQQPVGSITRSFRNALGGY